MLTPGAVHRRAVAESAPHRFRFEAPAGVFLHLDVEQLGVDVVVLLRGPGGRLLFEVDGPTGARGVETVLVVTPAAGEYVLEVEPFAEGKAGEVELAVREVRPAGEVDRLLAGTASALARAERRRLSGDFEAAIPAYREALAGFEGLASRGRAEDLGGPPASARARRRLGESLLETGELAEAAAELERAAVLLGEVEDVAGEARAFNHLGTARRLLGDFGRSVEAHERSLTLYRQAGVAVGEATVLNNLGLVLEAQGDLQAAADLYEKALLLWRQLGRKPAEAVTLQNLGSFYLLIGHDEEGMDLLGQALKLVEEGKDSERLPALIAMGWGSYLTGRPERSLDLYREAVELARRSGDRLSEAGAWDRRGTALRALGRHREAAASYSRALALCRELGSPHQQGHTLINLGWLDLETGAVERGRRRLQEAVELLVRSGDPKGEAYARIGLSRAERRLGAHDPAREQAEAAVRLVEEMHAGLHGPRSREVFLATRYNAFEELVALLMDLHRREPGAGHALRALEVAERARARGLLAAMAERPAAAGEGEARRRALRAEIRALEARRQALALRAPRDPRLGPLDAELREAGLKLDRLARGDGGSAGVRSLDAAEIRRLADDGTVLVVYLLSEPASFAWTVDREGVVAHRLPGRERIEKLARRVVESMSRASGWAQSASAAVRELEGAVLAPLRSRLAGKRRVVVMADGALHAVPFPALAMPAAREEGASRLLLEDHEIVMLPSATFLARQRGRLAGRRPAPGVVAVLADPVFSLDDERLAKGKDDRAPSAARELDLGPLRRLPDTAREADSILRVAPPGETFRADGLAAARDLVESGVLSRFRVVHFATHGLLHPVLPERSGIVLSLFDAAGRRREGFLAAPDVAELDLPVELVVLSACDTGLGREIRGEGLVGLTQAFYRAGARRLVVSSWKVEDQATAELMSRFYLGLFGEGLTPAEALRRAQLSLRAEPRWRSPYFWAGFSLHGDWR